LLLREAERTLGVCRRFAAAVPDRRIPRRMHEMVMARIAVVAVRRPEMPPDLQHSSYTDSWLSYTESNTVAL
jgi:hypothetical protein